MKIVLASGSPRRIKLLKKMGIDFEVRPADVEEKIFNDPVRTVEYNALLKARSVKKDGDVVLGFDTIVYLDGEILGKPSSEDEAYKLLRKLSGRVHKVYTGIAILTDERELVDHNVSIVKFKELSDEEIFEYIETGEPMDKAGAYGFQEKGRSLVEYVKGSQSNVIGLPMERLKKLLKKVVEI